MTDLKVTQEKFMSYLLAPDLEQNQQNFSQLIVDQQGAPLDIRLKIYSNAYRIRLKEVIETDHEKLAIYLGDALFDKMAHGFIEAYPSSFRSLRDFCDNLPAYLHNDEYFNQFPILADIAHFERRLLNAFDAAETNRLNFSKLQNLPSEQWPQCKLRFHPSVQIFSCSSNAVQCWQALKHEKTPPTPDYSKKQHWLLWRSEQRITEFISLEDYQLALINTVIQGGNFSDLCSVILEWDEPEHAPIKVLKIIKIWFDLKLINAMVIE